MEAVIRVIIGLVSPLHRIFLDTTHKRGYLNAWLPTSLKNVGELFITLKVIVGGVKLPGSLRKMERGQSSGNVPLTAAIVLLIVQYVVWPVPDKSQTALVHTRVSTNIKTYISVSIALV